MQLIRILSVSILLVQLCGAEFDPSRFNFGADWEYPSKNGKIDELKHVLDYWTIWIWEDDFIEYWHGEMLDTCRKYGQTPVFYGYLVAGLSGLGDADQGGRLDNEGGAWLRNNIGKVLSTYEAYAQKIASAYGTTKPVIWLMEPDYSQYCDNDGYNQPSKSEAAGYMKQMVEAIKKHLPNAYFSMDISPWDNAISSYYQNFDMSLFSFISNSGGRTEAGSDRIRYDNNNNVTWSGASSAAGGKCIIADDGYGRGGKPTGHASDWDDINNIKNRMRDGVIAITHKDPQSGWANTVKSLKSALSGESTKCSDLKFETLYALDVGTSSGGSVTRNPDAPTYTSGTTVTVSANPNSGYKFSSWSGDVTSSDPTLTLKMTKDYKIKANFVDINALVRFTLDVSTSGSGIVEVEPKQADYDSGSAVTLTARTVNGASFTSWGGDLSGETYQQSFLIMDGNKSVTAAFSGNTISIENQLKNGDFTDGEAGWTFGAYEDASAEAIAEDGKFTVSLQSSGTEDWHVQLMQEGITLKQDTKYTLSFTASSEGNATIIAIIGMGEDPYTSYLRKKVNLTSTEETYEYTFPMRKEPTPSDRFEINAGKATAGWTIDNISLAEAIELDPFTSIAPRSRKQTMFFSGIEKKASVSVTHYDHKGRVVWRTTGDYNEMRRQWKPHRAGSYITVLDINGVKQVKKTVVIGK